MERFLIGFSKLIIWLLVWVGCVLFDEQYPEVSTYIFAFFICATINNFIDRKVPNRK